MRRSNTRTEVLMSMINMEMSLFQHPQLDHHLFSFLDLESLISLRKVNSYYWITIRNTKYFRIILYYLRNERNITKTFIGECEDGTLETVQWIYDHHYVLTGYLFKRKEKIDLHAEHDQAFHNTCKHGKIEIAKYLLHRAIQLKTPIRLHYHYIDYTYVCYCPWRTALANNQLPMAIWLYHKGVRSKEACFMEGHEYYITCEKGYFEEVKWLFSLSIPSEEICSTAFQLACIHGHLEIAQYIYNLGIIPNLKLAIKRMIGNVCRGDHWKVAKWLMSMIDN